MRNKNTPHASRLIITGLRLYGNGFALKERWDMRMLTYVAPIFLDLASIFKGFNRSSR